MIRKVIISSTALTTPTIVLGAGIASMHHAPSISLITPSASYPYTVTAHALAMRGEAEQAIVYMIEFTMACHVTFLRVIRGIYHDSASNSQHIKTVSEVECFGKTGAR